MNNLRHVMLDLETISTKKNAAIISIGAVLFDPNTGIVGAPEGGMGDCFYEVIDPASRGIGHIDASTVMWWMGQSDEAREDFHSKSVVRRELSGALQAFHEWLIRAGLTDSNKRDWRLWANDPDFDVAIFTSAFERLDIPFPLSYGASRSMRTMCELAREFNLYLGNPEENTLKHNALADAVYQAHVVTDIKQAMRKRMHQK